VPQPEYYDLVAPEAVKQEVMDPRQMQPPYSGCSRVRYGSANSRFDADQRKSLRDAFIEGFGSELSILIPTLGGLGDFSE